MDKVRVLMGNYDESDVFLVTWDIKEVTMQCCLKQYGLLVYILQFMRFWGKFGLVLIYALSGKVLD